MSKIPRNTAWMSYSICGALILPLLVVASVILWYQIPDALPDGDAALLEISTRAALDGEQLTGPYSRNWFNHPGPVYFYLLAPLYSLTQGRTFSLHLTVTVINIVALVWMVIILQKMTTIHSALWGALLLAIYSRQLGSLLFDIWNPWVTILPFLVAMLAFAAAANGTLWFFPLGIVAASFVIQTHLGYTLALGITSTCALFLAICPPVRSVLGLDTAPKGRMLSVAVTSALIFLLLWFAPILEEIQGTPGNMTKIMTFFTQSAVNHSWEQTFQIFRTVFSYYALHIVHSKSPSELLDSAFPSWVIQSVVWIQIVLLVLAYCVARRQRQGYLAALSLMCGVLLPAIILSIHRIVGDILAYLVVWMTCSSVLCWMVIGGVVLQRVNSSHAFSLKTRTYFRNALLLLILVGFIMTTFQNTRQFFADIHDAIEKKDERKVTPQMLSVTAQVLKFLEEHAIVQPLLRPLEYVRWPTAAGLALKLTKLNIPSSIDPQFPTIYPSRYALAGQEEGMLLISSQETAASLKRYPSLMPIVDTPYCGIFWRSFSNGLEGEYAFEVLPSFARIYQGFSKTESNPEGMSYRWASASESTLQIPLSQNVRHRIVLIMAIRRPIRSITVFLNAQELTRIPTPQEWGWHEFVLDVPAEYVQTLNMLTFRYTYDGFLSDESAPPNSHKALAFNSLSVEKIPDERRGVLE